jgi:hypothetical protein
MKIEDRLRGGLQRLGSQIHPRADEAWTEVVGRIARPRHARSAPAMAAALVIGAASVTIAVLAFRTGRDDLRTPSDGDGSFTVVATLPADGDDVVQSSSRVWVRLSELESDVECDGAIAEVDPASGNILGMSRTNGTPEAFAVHDRHVYVAQSVCGTVDGSDGEVIEVDTETGRIDQLLRSLKGDPSGVAARSGVVWSVWQLSEDRAEVVRLDTGTGGVLRATIEGRIDEIVVAGDRVWLLDTGPLSGSLIALRSSDLGELGLWHVDPSPTGLVGSADSAWVGGSDGLVRVVDSRQRVSTPSVVGPIPVAEDPTGVWFHGAVDEGGRVLAHLVTATGATDRMISIDTGINDLFLPSDGTVAWGLSGNALLRMNL